MFIYIYIINIIHNEFVIYLSNMFFYNRHRGGFFSEHRKKQKRTSKICAMYSDSSHKMTELLGKTTISLFKMCYEYE